MAEYAISVKGLSKSFQQTKAVDNLNLNIAKGEFFGFLGPNGAGKTTTIRMLTGLLKPDKGEIQIEGLPSSQSRKISQLIGVVPESRGFYQWMTAKEYLQFFAALYRINQDKSKGVFLKKLEQVGMELHANSPIGTFSRGMKQRLGLARALINEPRILFLDEPTLGLDPQGQEDIQNLLRELNQKGVTIFFSSHLLYEVSNLCSRIAIISHGKLIIEGNMSDLMNKAGMNDTYLIKIKGDIDFHLLKDFSVNKIEPDASNGTADITMIGDYMKANQLLDKLREAGIPILEYRSDRDNLTQVFLNLTQGDKL